MTKVTKDHCLEIINKFEPCSENQKQGVLGIDGKSTVISNIDVSFFLFCLKLNWMLLVLLDKWFVVEMFPCKVWKEAVTVLGLLCVWPQIQLVLLFYQFVLFHFNSLLYSYITLVNSFGWCFRPKRLTEMACLRLQCDPNRWIQTVIYWWTTETSVHMSPFKKVNIIRTPL